MSCLYEKTDNNKFELLKLTIKSNELPLERSNVNVSLEIHLNGITSNE